MDERNLSPEILLLDNQLCFGLYAASRRVIQSYAPMLTRLNLTYPQYITLMVLWEHRRMSVGEIGEHLLLDSGTLTPLLQKMEAKGLVTRARSREDERRVIIEVAPAGEALKEQALAFLPSLLCTSGLSQQELVALRESLKKLLRALEGGDGCRRDDAAQPGVTTNK